MIPFGAGNADWKGVNEWLMTVFFNNVAGPDNVRKALSGELPWTAPPFVEAVELSKAWLSLSQTHPTSSCSRIGRCCWGMRDLARLIVWMVADLFRSRA